MFQVAAGRAPATRESEPFHEWVFPDGTLWTSFFRTRAGYLLRFPGIADFEVDDHGRRVTAWPADGVAASTVDHLYLNQVLPLAWSKQGRLVLHGSAVELHGRAVAFIGRSGFGKSTLAASLLMSGHRLLCDDGLLIESTTEGSFRVTPGHPSLRLWPDSEAALLSLSLQREPALPYTNKSRFAGLDDSLFCPDTRELQRIFFLGDGNALAIAITPMRASEALVELVKHSFLLDTEEKQLLSGNFDALSRLAALPICCRLDYPRDYQLLPRIREAIVTCTANS